ncbi:SdrH family protein [Staphylococcus simulans]|uniref:SdrH family protein n=1 Tax=Staphylococcus simulans TaxID=1286 RepID=UPI0021CDFDD5|nr:SdrH family protein [Staphylococcus simulans]UXR46063.1 SdrH family protein [Staphylococcus simulans]
MKKKVYKKLTLTIAATGLLLPSTVTHAAEQTQKNQQVPVSKQTETTKTQSDGLNNQSAPEEETLTQSPSDTSNESTSSSVQPNQQSDTTTQKEDQTTTQSNNTSTNEETNTTQEDTSQDTTKPQPNDQPGGSSTGAESSDNPNDSSNNTETQPEPTNPEETNPEEPKPEETNPEEKPSSGDNTEKPEDNSENDKGQGGGTIPQRGEGGSHPVEPSPEKPVPDEPTPEEPEPGEPSMPDGPTTPETPEQGPSDNNLPSNNKSGQNSYQPNQQVTPTSSYHPSADYIPNSSNFASATPSLNGGLNEQQAPDEVMPFSNLGLIGDRYGHLITGSFRYNPFIVHQVGMISDDTQSTEDDVHAVLQPQNFSNNSNLNNLQQSTGYFKYQYFSPMRAQQYYANLDLQILGLVTSDLGSMPDLKEVKRDKHAEAKQTTKPSEDTKQNADKAKKKQEEKTTDNQKYPRLLNTLLIVFGVAFIWCIVLMIMKRKKQ